MTFCIFFFIFCIHSGGAFDPGIDLLKGLNLHANISQFEGVSITQGTQKKTAYKLEGTSRQLVLPSKFYERAVELLKKNSDFTFAAKLKQDERNAGTIISFSHNNNRYEKRFCYHNPIRRWLKVAHKFFPFFSFMPLTPFSLTRFTLLLCSFFHFDQSRLTFYLLTRKKFLWKLVVFFFSSARFWLITQDFSFLLFIFVDFRYLEIQSSGRRNEIRFYYSNIGPDGELMVHVESFPYRLADNKWHKIALSISGTEIQLIVDCHPLYKRVTHYVPDRNFSASNMQLLVGQRNLNSHFLFKVSWHFPSVQARIANLFQQ